MIDYVLKQLANNEGSILAETDISDVESLLLDEKERLKPVSAAELRAIDRNKLRMFCLSHGIYSVPSIELISLLNSLIPDRDKALEIGAGNGVYGRALGVKMTDNYMQAVKNANKFKGVIENYALSGQPLVQYGDDVLEIDGREAVQRYKPETLLMSWVTHKWNARQPHRGGNMYGVDMEALLKRKYLKRIILVGNKHVHANSPLMNYPHQEMHLPDILFSRATHSYLDRVFVWDINQ